jgi:nickel-dependent lactate racemase
MPQFSKQGDYYYISYITGPAHVMLGLIFSKEHVVSPKVVQRPAIGEHEHSALDEKEIERAVIEGIESANKRLGSDYFVSEIVYVVNDSPRYELYKHCAELLLERLLFDEGESGY